MNKYPKISIIIPLYVKTPYFFESVEKCLELDYPDFEILIGVDEPLSLELKNKKIKVLHTGSKRTGPAEKRDIGIRKATGEYIAFLDDDSYPAVDWLKNSIKQIRKQKVSSVCGPGLTPPADSFTQKITGAILGSLFGSGPYFYRFIKGSPRYVDDYPAYNMIVSKKALQKIGGFGTKFYGGEDTALCIKLINAGEKIYYHPDIVVYHHRREFPMSYAKQVGNVGKHRGFFVKKYPQTSLRISYFLPALFTLIVPIFVLSAIFIPTIRIIIAISLIGFYLAVFFESLNKTTWVINSILPFAIAINYFAYGANFISGLFFTKKLAR